MVDNSFTGFGPASCDTLCRNSQPGMQESTCEEEALIARLEGRLYIRGRVQVVKALFANNACRVIHVKDAPWTLPWLEELSSPQSLHFG